MPITAKLLKDIMAEARPIIERQMDDAKLIAGFRDVVSRNGGDWGALKALIKAHVEDENDDTGEGKRVQKIRDKADSTSAYADMLGLSNMNDNNFSPQSKGETNGPEVEPTASSIDEIAETNSNSSEPIQSPEAETDKAGDSALLPAIPADPIEDDFAPPAFLRKEVA